MYNTTYTTLNTRKRHRKMSDKLVQSELVIRANGSVLTAGELDLKDPDQVEAQKAIAKHTTVITVSAEGDTK